MIKRALTTIVCLIALLLFLPSAGKAATQRWLADLKAVCLDDSQRLILGASSQTTDGFDVGADTGATLMGNLMAYFSHPEWNRSTPYYWTDVKDLTLPKEWAFYVSSSYVNREITLKWDFTDVPATLNLYLTDEAGNSIDMKAKSSYAYTNTTTAVRTFTVRADGSVGDATPPETMITTAPPAFVNGSSVNIEYSGSDDTTTVNALTYSYSLDAGEWSAWSGVTSASLSALSAGAHVFYVKARDEAGNIDQTPAEASFTVDTISPVLVLNQPNPAILWPPDGTMREVRFSGNVYDAASGIDTIVYTLIDEYGEFAYTGSVVPSDDGSFSISLRLKLAAQKKDRDGRLYTITITARDRAGNAVTSSKGVTVPVKKKDHKKKFLKKLF